MAQQTTRRPVTRLRVGSEPQWRPDALAVEEPLEVRVNGVPFTTTMRTPGDDIDLALGALVAAGVCWQPSQVATAQHCARAVGEVMEVRLTPAVRPPDPNGRLQAATSACGLCGSAVIDDVVAGARWPLPVGQPKLDAGVLMRLPNVLAERQQGFAKTGGLHAAGLCTPDGDLLVVREDVGRHNAVDKVIGWALQHDRLPMHDLVLVVSARAGFELVHKAVQAGVPALVAVSAPTSLAVDTAERLGLTLLGFSRGDRANVYADAGRLVSGPA